MSSPEPFPYPPLPPSVDAIRILTVQRGELFEPLKCTLTVAPFSTKPRYAALSYTWGLPHIDLAAMSKQMSTKDPELFTLTINNHSFPVHANLALCLYHLRSKSHAFPLWVDAICINQADIPERNAQVALMSFIYSRARIVVAWLGIRELTLQNNNNSPGPVEIMAEEAKSGAIKQLAGLVVDTHNKTRFRSSPEPGRNTFDFGRVATSSYWTRLWIVQEVCLAREVVFTFGGKAWLFGEVFSWGFLEQARELAKEGRGNGLENERAEARAMLRLLEARAQRHTDMMRFESLVERFANQACSETRDGVYALLGVANDIRASDEEDQEIEPSSKRGTGTLMVDYTRSHYNIWADATKFAFFRARKNRLLFQRAEECAKLSDLEREVTIVRTAAVIQKALNGEVEKEFSSLIPPPSIRSHVPEDGPVLHCMGYIAGEITGIGPGYTSLVGSFRAEQQWLTCCEDAYKTPRDLEQVRALNEAYLTRIMDYTDKELARICEMPGDSAIAWRKSHSQFSPPSESTERMGKALGRVGPSGGVLSGRGSEPNICIGTDHLIALVPGEAELGDVVVRFWNCDAALVMRSTTMIEPHVWVPVGRADVATARDRDDPSADSERLCRVAGPGEFRGPVSVHLRLEILQFLTAGISVFGSIG